MIPRRSLHEALVDSLRDMIIEGELAAGTRVPEKALCLRFGVSRTPLREALKVLASEGMLTLPPNRGAWVAPLTAAEVDEVVEVLAALEALAGPLAARRATAAQVKEIEALHYEMRAEAARGNLRDYFRLNQEIHRRIIEAAGNPTLAATYAGLNARIRRARYQANLSPERWQRAIQEHEAILQALLARNGERLGRLLHDHLFAKAAMMKSQVSAAA
ncbi:MAG: GntR family transcriptional regulator [Thalassobaculales bacterium]